MVLQDGSASFPLDTNASLINVFICVPQGLGTLMARFDTFVTSLLDSAGSGI